MEIEVLVFECEQQLFAVRANYVREVLRAVALSPMPQAPAGVMGIVNVRGTLLPVVDTKKTLGLSESRLLHTDHFVIVTADAIGFALRVDRALDLCRIQSDSIQTDEASEVSAQQASACIEMVAKNESGIIHVINPKLVLDASGMSDLRSFAQRAAVSNVNR